MLVVAVVGYGQSERDFVRKGNKQFRQKQNFEKAETEYRKATTANRNYAIAQYNLGCALLAQQKDSAAVEQFQMAGKMETDKIRKSQSWHNVGVICQSRKMFKEAIDAYKIALRNNPKDDESRYNLVLCQRQLKKQQQQQQNQQDQQKDDKGQDQKQEKQQQDKKDPKQQPKEQEKMSKENAEQLLQAAVQNEKNTQEKMKKQQGQPNRRTNMKNW